MKRKLTYAKDKEAVEQNHDLYCWLHDIPFNSRTVYSCNCSARDQYKQEFDERRKNKKPR